MKLNFWLTNGVDDEGVLLLSSLKTELSRGVRVRGGRPSEEGTKKGKSFEGSDGQSQEGGPVGMAKKERVSRHTSVIAESGPVGSPSRSSSAIGEKGLLESASTGDINEKEQPVKWEVHQEAVRISVTDEGDPVRSEPMIGMEGTREGEGEVGSAVEWCRNLKVVISTVLCQLHRSHVTTVLLTGPPSSMTDALPLGRSCRGLGQAHFPLADY